MKRTSYDRLHQAYISFPLGGLGTGSLGLGGNGRLIDWEIRNRPAKGSDCGYSHFAVKAERNGTLLDARVLQSDNTRDLTGQYGHGYGSGLRATSMEGFPHFRECLFEGEYPLAHLRFRDDTFPGRAELVAFNPLIPLNDLDSGIPAAFFEYRITNTTDAPIDYTVAASLCNANAGSVNRFLQAEGCSALFLSAPACKADSFDLFDTTISAPEGADVSYQEYWYRGGWFDGLETYWRNFTETRGPISNRRYDEPGANDTASLYVRKSAAPGETVVFRFCISWNAPNRRNYWDIYTEKNDDGEDKEVPMRNFYAYRFENSFATAKYVHAHWDRLYAETRRYHDVLFDSTLPEAVLDAVSATTSVLKTETALRIDEKGDFFGWEGLFEHDGSCPGTCSHVWNYAYAMCFLFPNVERNIRETDFHCNQRPSGSMLFRTRIPFGRGNEGFRACVDGQMGGVLKTYREWKLSGDTAWLKSLWPYVKKSLEFAWSPENPDRWDADRDGVLEGRQHHTLDMELFGPSAWLEGFYLGALKAAAEMARALDETETAEMYEELFRRGAAWTKANLFNGEYFVQKTDLKNRGILERFADEDPGVLQSYWNSEVGEIKYQIGEGCALDQLLAQWHGDISGLGSLFDDEQVHTALGRIYRHNFKENMRSHYNTFRIFAADDEAGGIICDYPAGKPKPAIPIPYAQESMHGFEYAFAGLLISRGYVQEGIRMVTAVRDRYTGDNRNPWNEIECGSNYARSMASFALLPILSGMSFDMTKGRLGFAPRYSREAFACFFAVGNAWGQYRQDLGAQTASLTLCGGELSLKELKIADLKPTQVTVDGVPVAFTLRDGAICFENTVCTGGEIVCRC